MRSSDVQPSLLVDIEWRERVAIITLRVPERRNALSRQLADAIVAALEGAVVAGARAVVLTGEGLVFCAGGDLDDLGQVIEDGPTAVAGAVYGRFQRVALALRESVIPVIAAINGPAVGAGFDIALACQIRTITREAWLSSAWIKLGLVTGMGATHRLTELIGSGRAAELTLTGRRVGADEALAWGLVNQVCAPGSLVDDTVSLAETVTRHPEEAVRETLASLRRSGSTTLRAELETLAAVQARLLTGAAFRDVIARVNQS